jgi:hypothetical protein
MGFDKKSYLSVAKSERWTPLTARGFSRSLCKYKTILKIMSRFTAYIFLKKLKAAEQFCGFKGRVRARPLPMLLQI